MNTIKNFYPTPEALAKKMVEKLHKGGPCKKILEPSAGKGDLITALRNYSSSTERHYYRPFEHADVSAIEINPVLQATLRGSRVKVIDSDFLNFAGHDKFDAILANVPFEDGDKHLTKALDIMYRGQIVCLVNAETIRNPHTRARKALVERLNKLGAKIEFIKNAFTVAERKTKVEVALIHVKIDRKVEDDLFANMKDKKGARSKDRVQTKGEIIQPGRTIETLVAEYNEIVNVGTETILAFYRNFRKVGKYLSLNDIDKKHLSSSDDDLTARLQNQQNQLLQTVRTDFWRRTLELPEVTKRLTTAKRKEFLESLKTQCDMDFTANNIRQFIVNLIGSYEQTLTEAVLDIFDMFTKRHSWHKDNVYAENVHYFNGWASNDAFKVNKKVVIPIYGSYGGAFFRDAKYSFGRWDLDHGAAETLCDIDKVASYFDGMGNYTSMATAITRAFGDGKGEVQTSNIKSTYFTCRVFKKNTIHITFNDEGVLRRFNLAAARGKGWLPQDYGVKPYKALTAPEKAVVDSFEGEESYKQFVGKPLFAVINPQLRLAA